MTKVILVRLAETEGTEKIKGGKQKAFLSERGRLQAEFLRDRLRNYRIDVIFSSTSEGCVETAKIIAEPYGVKIEPCSEFLEINLGEWEGKTQEEMRKQFPDLFEYFRTNVPLNSGDMQITPGGETRNQVQKRVFIKLNQIVNQWKDSNVLIVSHGHTIKVIICSLLGLDFSNIWKINQPNCALNLFEYNGNNVLFHLIGDISHLEKKDISSYSFQKKKSGLEILVMTQRDKGK